MTNYFISLIFAIVGITIIIFNKSLSEKLGAFYSKRFTMTYGKLSHILCFDQPNGLFSRVVYRGFVITAGITFLIFSVAAFFGTNFVGPSAQPTNSLLQVQN